MGFGMRKALLLVFCAVLALHSAEQHTTVTKRMTNNPSIGIVSFAGNTSEKNSFERVLECSGWFTVLKGASAKGADIKVNLQMPSQNSVSASVNAGPKNFTVSQNGENAMLNAVDDILRALYKLPAYCTKKIYFVQDGANNMKEIFCCYLDGSGLERVTHNSAISTEPSWGHPEALVYTVVRRNSLAVVLSDMKNKRQRIISNSPGLNSSAALSHDGRRLALPLSLENQIDLYIVELDKGGTRTRLTKNRDVESSPCWSPDNKRICYVSDRLGVPQLYLRDAAQGGVDKRISAGNNECVSPDWSPVSNKICFSYKTNTGQRHIAVMDMNDSSQQIKVITHAAGDWEAPSWAPDGRHIVCTRSTGNGFRDLFIVDSWSNAMQPVSRNARVSLPAWRP